MPHEISLKLDEISKRVFELNDIDHVLSKELSVRASNLSAQIAVQRGLDEIVKLVREEKPLPVRRIGFNIKKLSDGTEKSQSRWLELQKLDFTTLIFCTLSFSGLSTLPHEQFNWLLDNAQCYLEARDLPPTWIATDQIRKVITNTPRQENTRAFLENYHKLEIQLCNPNKPSILEEASSKQGHIGDHSSCLQTLTLPLTAEAAEVILAYIREGLSDGLTISFPQPQVHFPFVTVPYNMCTKLMEKYTTET